ncbi:metallophosphoesterase family protein [Corynebacterium gerontici]|uniref:Nuclease SbcCD subunit D n=1 Tax=Corynebacterium gerontici TaxID=2079234 RepID=A0A3G6J593_9CORY|nr:metallophosphoesterase [Corynebacterium gerontici]AZA11204.1 putative metallophosphoesterase YhaO [Corynebacterium gerontici]
MKTTFLHTSDFQIGMRRWWLDAEAEPRFANDRIQAIRRVHDLALQFGCDFIVVAGDFFDANSLSMQTILRVKEELKRLKIPAVFVAGNHDPLTADSMYGEIEGMDNVVVARDNTPFEVVPGVEVVAAPLKVKRADSDLVAAAIEGLEPSATIRIAVGHGQAESRSNDIRPDEISLSLVEQRICEGAIDFLALGDTHSAQPVGSSGKVWFSGSPEATDFRNLQTGGGENNSGNALVVAIEKTGAEEASVSVSEHQVGQWTFEEHTSLVNSLEDAKAFVETLERYPDKRNTAIRYSLQGVVNLETSQYLEDELTRLEEVFAALYEHERFMDMQVVPDDGEVNNLGLSGFAVRALEELHQREDDTARNAAKLLLRLGRK